MVKPILLFAVFGLLLGCAADAPSDLDVFAPNFAEAGNSGCHTVSGEIAQTGLAPSFSGTITGDIEGDVSTQLDLASSDAAGQVRFSTAEQTWEVTGGTVPELIGRTVRLTLETEIVFALPPVGRNNTRATVVDGAEMGILTYHGTLNASPPPPFSTHVEYRGVICP
jgi:hypothetical protein